MQSNQPADTGTVVGSSDELDSTGCGRSAAEALVEADLLVEDVSIDGMCGVY